MRQLFVATAGVALLGLSLAARDAQGPAAASAPPAARAGTRAGSAPSPRRRAARRRRAVADGRRRTDAASSPRYCATCHSERGKAGGLSLASFDAMKAHEQPEVIEKMIRKLRAGMMPPPGAKRPDAAQIDQLAGALEARMDEFAASNPNPGWRPFQRLTRAEYSQAVKDLLDLEVDVTPYLPADTQAHGFDNIAEAQGFSPALLDGYLRAASQVSRLAHRRQAGVADVGDLPRAAGRVADALRRGHAARVARRHRRGPQLPRRRRLQVHGAAAAHDQRRAVRQHRHRHGRQQRAARDLGQRRTRRGARGQGEHERRLRAGLRDRHAADPRQGRPAAHRRGVRAALRRPGRRPDDADRPHPGRHAHRHRLRHHRGAAHPGPGDHRPDEGHRHLGHAEPPPRLRLPADGRRTRSAAAPPTPCAGWRRRRSAGRSAPPTWPT